MLIFLHQGLYTQGKGRIVDRRLFSSKLEENGQGLIEVLAQLERFKENQGKGLSG
jgi:hypothetical protein